MNLRGSVVIFLARILLPERNGANQSNSILIYQLQVIRLVRRFSTTLFYYWVIFRDCKNYLLKGKRRCPLVDTRLIHVFIMIISSFYDTIYQNFMITSGYGKQLRTTKYMCLPVLHPIQYNFHYRLMSIRRTTEVIIIQCKSWPLEKNQTHMELAPTTFGLHVHYSTMCTYSTRTRYIFTYSV